MNNLPKKDPRPDFRVTDNAIEKRLTRHVVVAEDGVEIEISSAQYRDNVYERGVPLSVQLGRDDIRHVTTKTVWLVIVPSGRAAPVRDVAPLN